MLIKQCECKKCYPDSGCREAVCTDCVSTCECIYCPILCEYCMANCYKDREEELKVPYALMKGMRDE
jgi:hypothetical protein